MYAAIHKAFTECGLTWIEKYKTTKYFRRGLKDLKQYNYGVYYIEEVIGKPTKKIPHVSHHNGNTVNSYESYTGLLRGCF